MKINIIKKCFDMRMYNGDGKKILFIDVDWIKNYF